MTVSVVYHVILQRAPLRLNSHTSDIIILIDDVIVIVSVRTVFYRLIGSWRLH